MFIDYRNRPGPFTVPPAPGGDRRGRSPVAGERSESGGCGHQTGVPGLSPEGEGGITMNLDVARYGR